MSATDDRSDSTRAGSSSWESRDKARNPISTMHVDLTHRVIQFQVEIKKG
jgi:hypothetical protein